MGEKECWMISAMTEDGAMERWAMAISDDRAMAMAVAIERCEARWWLWSVAMAMAGLSLPTAAFGYMIR
jgi:hypothetical protein